MRNVSKAVCTVTPAKPTLADAVSKKIRFYCRQGNV